MKISQKTAAGGKNQNKVIFCVKINSFEKRCDFPQLEQNIWRLQKILESSLRGNFFTLSKMNLCKFSHKMVFRTKNTKLDEKSLETSSYNTI